MLLPSLLILHRAVSAECTAASLSPSSVLLSFGPCSSVSALPAISSLPPLSRSSHAGGYDNLKYSLDLEHAPVTTRYLVAQVHLPLPLLRLTSTSGTDDHSGDPLLSCGHHQAANDDSGRLRRHRLLDERQRLSAKHPPDRGLAGAVLWPLC
jgi:hypothetical protein